MATRLADVMGTNVTISGVTFYAFVTVPKPTMSLESGGFNTDKAITLRWPTGRAARPSVGTQVLLVEENLTFRVETATSLAGSSIGSSEIQVTAVRE